MNKTKKLDKEIMLKRACQLEDKMHSIGAPNAELMAVTYCSCCWKSYELEFLIEYDKRWKKGNDKYGIYLGVRAKPSMCETPCSDDDIKHLTKEWEGFINFLERNVSWPIQKTDNAGTEGGYWIFWAVLGDRQDIKVAVKGVELIYALAKDYFDEKEDRFSFPDNVSKNPDWPTI